MGNLNHPKRRTLMAKSLLSFALCLFVLATVPCGARAQVVQLPSFQQTGISTTVVVPDQGGAYLGGIQRGAMGSSTSGVPLLGNVPGAGRLFRNRGIGSSLSSSSFGVTATIIDLNEMDRQILGETAARRTLDPEEARIAEKAAFLSQHVAKENRSLDSLARKSGSNSRPASAMTHRPVAAVPASRIPSRGIGR